MPDGILTPATTRHLWRRAVPRPKRHPQNFTNFAGPDWGGIILRVPQLSGTSAEQ